MGAVPDYTITITKIMNSDKKTGFTFIELLVSIIIMLIIAGGMVAMKGPFEHRIHLDSTAVSLQEDLRYTQMLAMSQKNAYKYYGLRFYGNLGPNADRQGWKIVRYEPNTITPPINVDIAPVTYIKSSQESDNPQELDNTYFNKPESIHASSDFQIVPAGQQRHSVVFNESGSATIDGSTLLTEGTQTEIVLTSFGRTVTLHITRLTGHIEKL